MGSSVYKCIRARGVRELLKAHRKQCSAEFLAGLDRITQKTIERAIVANGGKTRLGADLIGE